MNDKELLRKIQRERDPAIYVRSSWFHYEPPVIEDQPRKTVKLPPVRK